MTTGPADVDAYIASFPEEERVALQGIRERALAVAPDAAESISYGVPTLKVGGKVLLHFGGFAKHVSVYPVPPTDDAEFATEIAQHRAGKGTLKFPLSRPIPYDFVERVARAHLARLDG